MSAELLRRAAALLREHAETDRELPPPALALAAWLGATAEVAEANDAHDGFDLDAVDDTYRAAVATARAILREEDTR
jgi:hypothetical protein